MALEQEIIRAQDAKVYALEFDRDPTEQEVTDALVGAVESKDPSDAILLLTHKMQAQTELVELLVQMQLEKEGLL